MVGVVEGDDGVAAGEVARDLDGVLDGLGAGVEERGALLVVTGRQVVEGLGDLEVLLVGRHHEAGVGEVLHLRGDAVDDARGGVADGRHGDAGAEVDELVAVDVDEDAATGTLDVDRQAGGDAGGHGRRLAGLERGRLRAGDRGLQEPLLGDVAHASQYAVRPPPGGTRGGRWRGAHSAPGGRVRSRTQRWSTAFATERVVRRDGSCVRARGPRRTGRGPRAG